MIDWKATKKEYGRTDLQGQRPRVIVICGCGSTGSIQIRKKSNIVNNQLVWHCAKCVANRPSKKEKSKIAALKAWKDNNYRKQITENSKSIWDDPNRRKQMSTFRNNSDFKQRMAEINKAKELTPGGKRKLSETMKEKWKSEKYRSDMKNKLSRANKEKWQNKQYRSLMIKKLKERWADKKQRRALMLAINKACWENDEYANKMRTIFASNEFRNKMSEINQAIWRRPGHSKKMREILTRNVSSIQEQLYSILKDLNVQFHREYPNKQCDQPCVIGPYTFDCHIPMDTDPDLLIECQGNYWHSLPQVRSRDQSKASYISNNFQGVYELKYIWEHEFNNYNKVNDLIKYWLGITQIEIEQFNFKDVSIEHTPREDYKLLLSKYHYLTNAGRGGITYGAYLNNELIACCVFSPLPRQNISIANYSADKCRELSRFCIHPKYQKKNFGSWFLSRALSLLSNRYKIIVAYADTTFNHSGTIYKAANFTMDNEVTPDYWYTGPDGWVMHKKTLYNQARSLKMKEQEFAESYGYIKIHGHKKLRFIYERTS
jgi:GNAT superfamily N-acetyltransferase